ncbi:hypothetical protein [Primorskyibacter sp. S87]|uniref:hypothetical protein n=1 Tax=Primorskyibacter sp. S87 TaxID=3415126 RepID=UPI003C7D3BEE
MLMGEPGWLDDLARLKSRIGVLTFEPSISFDSKDNPRITEDHGAPRFHPVMMSEFAVNVMLMQATDAPSAVLLAMMKLLSFAGRRDRVHGVTVEGRQKVVDPAHVRTDLDHGRSHVTLVPTRCIAPPDFTLDRLVDAMNPDRPMMEHLMRHGALNGWPDDAQRLFDLICDRPEWTLEQAATGLAQLKQLGLVVMPEADVPVVHPAHFAQMPAGMVSSAAQTMDTHRDKKDLLNDDGTIDGTKIANAPEPGTTQGSKRKKARRLSKNQRLQRRVEDRNEQIAEMEISHSLELAAKDERIAELEAELSIHAGISAATFDVPDGVSIDGSKQGKRSRR